MSRSYIVEDIMRKAHQKRSNSELGSGHRNVESSQVLGTFARWLLKNCHLLLPTQKARNVENTMLEFFLKKTNNGKPNMVKIE